MYSIEDFQKGQRVQLAPHTDQWMMGARFGRVTSVGKVRVLVKLDKLPTFVIRCHPSDICEILPS